MPKVMVTAVDMVLADSIVPVLRCRGELVAPIVMYKQKEQRRRTVNKNQTRWALQNKSLQFIILQVVNGVEIPINGLLDG